MKARRVIRRLLIVVFATCLAIVAASVILNKVVQKKIEEQLSSLPPSLRVTFSFLRVNLLSSSASFGNLQISYSPYPGLPRKKHLVSFDHASLKGIGFLSFAFSRKLVADKLVLEGGNIEVDQFLLDKKDSAQDKLSKVKWPFKALSIGNIELKGTKILTGTGESFHQVANGDLSIGQVQMSSADAKPHFETMDCKLSGVDYALPHSKDTIQIQKLLVNSSGKVLRMDSLRFHSGNKASIPSLVATGFDLSKLLNDHVLSFDKITIDQPVIDVDRREQFASALPFDIRKVEVGSFQLHNGLLSYKDSVNQCRLRATIVLNGVDANPSDKNGFHLESARCSLSDFHYSGQHPIEMKRMDFDSKTGSMEVKGLEVFSVGKTVVPSVSASGIDLDRLLNDHLLFIKKLKIDRASLNLPGNNLVSAPETLPFEPRKIRVDDFQFTNGSVSYKGKGNACRMKANINLEGLDVNGFNAASAHFSSARCVFSDVHYSENTHYNIDVQSAVLDSRRQIIKLNNLRIVPQFGKYEFDRMLGHQADRIEATIPKVEIIRPQFEALLQQKLFADKIKISSSTAYIFRDRRLPRTQTASLLPMEYLIAAPIEIRVKTCELARSNVEYEEYPASGFGQTGIFKLESASATLSPLINHPLPTDPGYLTMKVSASVMGTGTATATMLMPVRKNRPYRIKGRFEKLDLPQLNSSSENLGKIRIKSGFLDFLDFDFTMTDQQSTGQIVGAYHNLVIQQLKKHTKDKNVAGFSSFMLRHFIIPLNKDESVAENKRTGSVTYRRDPTRFVTYYYLHTLLRAVEASFTLGFLLPK